MEKTGQIFKSQYGFRSQHSCENAVSELVSEVTKGIPEWTLYCCFVLRFVQGF